LLFLSFFLFECELFGGRETAVFSIIIIKYYGVVSNFLSFSSAAILIHPCQVVSLATPFQSVCVLFGSEKELCLKDHVAAAYYAPSIGWSFSLSCE
jgi:hypothetical protein